VAYCNCLSVKIASENSSEDEFETLHGPVRPYSFKPTAKPGVEWINLIYLCRSITQKMVLGLSDNINFNFVSLRTDITMLRYNTFQTVFPQFLQPVADTD